MEVRVKLGESGYYDLIRRKAGQVFILRPKKKKDGSIVPPEKQFSDRWMEPVRESDAKKLEKAGVKAVVKPKPPESPADAKITDSGGETPTGDAEVI